MKIHVNAITAEGMDLEQDISSSDLNLDTDQIHCPESVHVKAHAERQKDVVTVNCDIRVSERQVCSKCLAEFEAPQAKKADFVYELTGQHVIDLRDNIKDTIILEYPIKILCKPDCKGLCVSCGSNLNVGPCDCDV
ncbi:DUF177 domain-containing protein [Candidatus Omnitrophota bacterium]